MRCTPCLVLMVLLGPASGLAQESICNPCVDPPLGRERSLESRFLQDSPRDDGVRREFRRELIRRLVRARSQAVPANADNAAAEDPGETATESDAKRQ